MALNFGGSFIAPTQAQIPKGQWNDDKSQTQVIVHGTIDGATISYTVPANKTFYLTQVYWRFNSGTSETAELQLSTGENLVFLSSNASDTGTKVASFSPPLKFATGITVELQGSSGGTSARGTLIGMLDNG